MTVGPREGRLGGRAPAHLQCGTGRRARTIGGGELRSRAWRGERRVGPPTTRSPAGGGRRRGLGWWIAAGTPAALTPSGLLGIGNRWMIGHRDVAIQGDCRVARRIGHRDDQMVRAIGYRCRVERDVGTRAARHGRRYRNAGRPSVVWATFWQWPPLLLSSTGPLLCRRP